MWRSFWNWYEKKYVLNVSIAASLFLLQLIHLFWLGGEVVWARLFGEPLFIFRGVWEKVIILVDYTEIPALISVSLLYVDDVRRSRSIKGILYLIFLNSQWLHLFWITDEFVVGAWSGAPLVIPMWLAWIAILIDYLEVPVMFDTIKRFLTAIR